MKLQSLGLALALVPAAAWPAAALAAGNPAPKAPAALRHVSAFDGYKPYRDIPRADWRGVNDTVAGVPGSASGHAAHGAAPAAASAAPPAMPMHGAGAAHGQHGAPGAAK